MLCEVFINATAHAVNTQLHLSYYGTRTVGEGYDHICALHDKEVFLGGGFDYIMAHQFHASDSISLSYTFIPASEHRISYFWMVRFYESLAGPSRI